MADEDDDKGDLEGATAEGEPKAAEPEKSSEQSEDSPRKSSVAKASSSTKARHKPKSKERAAAASASRGSALTSSRVALVAVVALAAGGAAGWFGHEAQAKAKLRAESAPAAAGSASAAGPCGAWEKQLCAGGGAGSAVCQQAKDAVGLLTPSTCEVALASVPATLAKVKAARASCDNLVTKLCKDLPPAAATCKMVTERTQSFPAERCKEMLEHYDEVLAQLRAMEQQQQQGGMPMGAPPGPSPH